jgi:hypothetical protein
LTRRVTLVVGLLLAALVVWSAVMVDRYGEAAYIPELVSGFAATFVAFVLALEFESRRESRALARAEEATNHARTTEARKRLLSLRTELEKNRESVATIDDGLRSQAEMGGTVWRILHPQLLNGAWVANGERLGDLLADYELVSDLAVFYGRLEELRWRVRYRTQERRDDLDAMTRALSVELRREVDDLLERVSAEEPNPSVRLVGLDHRGALHGTITLTSELSAEKIADETEASGHAGD